MIAWLLRSAQALAGHASRSGAFNVSQSTISRLADKALPPALPAKSVLDAETERAARAFMRRLEGKYPLIEGAR
jgi:hypothetical protein